MQKPRTASSLVRLRKALVLTSLASLTSLTCLALSACGEDSGRFEQAIELLEAPVALHDTLMFVDTLGSRAFLLDVSAKRPAARAESVPLPYGPAYAEQRHGKKQALVLCNGRRSTERTDAEPAALAVVSNEGEVQSYELGTTPFDKLVQSEDGRYVVLFRTAEESDRLLNNGNELAIVDLDKKPSDELAVVHKTPPSFGNTPTAAFFSPVMRIAGEDRRLLVVLSAAEVTLVDLGHLADRRETIVQIGGASSRRVNPVQVIFGAGEPTLYIRAEASDDIYVFRLEPQDNPGGNDFRPSINQLGGGVGPRDMALYGEPDSPRLLVVAQASSDAIVVDPSSSKATTIDLPILPGRVLLYQASSPKDPEQRTRALLYGQSVSSVAFLDLDDIETKRGRNLEVLPLDSGISSVIPLLDEDKVILVQQGRGVSLLDLAQRTLSPINSNAELADALFDPTSSRLWVGPSGQPRVGTLDLATGTTDEVLLDANVARLVPLFDIGRLAIVHASTVGRVTLVDTKNPERDTAASVRGFLIADVLDRGER